MSANSESRTFPSYKELIAHFRTPLFRNGYFLALSSLATSGIGLIYWIIAAHQYPTYVLGLNSAIIAAMTFLAGVSELNLMSALIRFIPIAGRSTKRFVLLTYIISLAVAAVIAHFFVEYLSIWSPALTFLDQSSSLEIWFILSTMCWCIFVLQDSVLTGLRQASWVPIENTVFSLTKIALMVIFAVTIPALGIFASWSFALVVAILPTNYFIFRKLIPMHTQKEIQGSTPLEASQIVRFAAADYLGALFWIIATTLMPVIVTSVSGATANAYFYLAWTIANTLYLIGPAMGSSLVVETARDQQKLGLYSLRVFKNTTKIVIPIAAVITMGAPYILLIFGKGYSSEGTTLLRLLAISAVPSTVNTIFVSVARVQRRTRAVAITLGSLCTLLLGLSYTLLKLYGIVGVGIGWVISQTFIAGIVYTTHLRELWRKTGEAKLIDKFDPANIIGNGSILQFFYQLSRRLRLFSFFIMPYRKWSYLKRQAKTSGLMHDIIKNLPQELYNPSQEQLKVHQVVDNFTNTTIAYVGPSNGSSRFMLKIPGSAKETESLKRQSANLRQLYNKELLGEWVNLLPLTLSSGIVNGQPYFVERALPGKTIQSILIDRTAASDTLSLAVEEIGILHRKTAHPTIIGTDLLDQWVDAPLNTLYRYISQSSNSQVYQKAIDNLKVELHSALIGRIVYTSWIHGDFCPSNILTNPSGTTITGIVDWDLSRPDELPLLDLIHLLVSVRMELEDKELGKVTRELLIINNWRADELKLIKNAENSLPGGLVDIRTLLILCWLHHVIANINKTARFDHHQVWISENILSVLQIFLEDRPGVRQIQMMYKDELP